ncbi:hypothetical protein BSKO_12158 [Bryopsis sp. KO-2023]|nr:hypothetical protein BSKO_12158 [Bryopsis sp. KO-2023]
MYTKLSRSDFSVREALLGADSAAITEAPEIVLDIDHEEENDMQGVREAMLRGKSVSHLIKEYPYQILRAIRQDGVHFIGDMFVEDSLVLASFGNKVMLTRGVDEKNDINWRANWMSTMEELASKATPKMGWCKPVKVLAYVVAIKNSASPKEEGLLHPLLLNIKAGAVEPAVMGLPVVRAILNYKWHTWARRTLILETTMYMGWLIAFFLFLIFFRAQGPSAWKEDGLMSGGFATAGAICNFLAMIFMLPFVIIEVNTIWNYRLGWISLWNLIDLSTYTLQIITFFMYFSASQSLGTHWFSVAAALQSILIFLRLQFFFRAFSVVRMSLVDLMAVVIHKAQFFILFLFLTLLSFAVSFHLLYRDLDDDMNPTQTSSHFENLWKSFTTVFGMMMGGFEYNMFFKTGGPLPIMTSIFFIVFQTLVAIMFLNLLIAIMTEAYLKIMEQEQLYRDSSRAQVIDELEMTLPRFMLRKKTHAYVHFLVVKRKKKGPWRAGSLPGADSLESIFNAPQGSLQSLPSLKNVDAEDKVLEKLAEKVAVHVKKLFDNSGQLRKTSSKMAPNTAPKKSDNNRQADTTQKHAQGFHG